MREGDPKIWRKCISSRFSWWFLRGCLTLLRCQKHSWPTHTRSTPFVQPPVNFLANVTRVLLQQDGFGVGDGDPAPVGWTHAGSTAMCSAPLGQILLREGVSRCCFIPVLSPILLPRLFSPPSAVVAGRREPVGELRQVAVARVNVTSSGHPCAQPQLRRSHQGLIQRQQLPEPQLVPNPALSQGTHQAGSSPLPPGAALPSPCPPCPCPQGC